MTPTTPALLDTLEELAREATPGPWPEPHSVDFDRAAWFIGGHNTDSVLPWMATVRNEKTARYIAALDPSTVLLLVAQARRAGELAEALEEVLRTWHRNSFYRHDHPIEECPTPTIGKWVAVLQGETLAALHQHSTPDGTISCELHHADPPIDLVPRAAQPADSEGPNG